MSFRRCNTGWASSLGGLFIITSLGLALGACSGGDGGDEPLDEAAPSQPSAPVATPPAAPTSTPRAGNTPPDTVTPAANEGGPNVAGRDPSNPAERADAEDEIAPSASENDAVTPMAATGELAVPATALCESVADWDPEWVQFEEEVLLLVNEVRSEPASCGAEGSFAAAAPLVMNPILRCSSRLHSLDMYERDYFDHDTPDGVDPFERMAEAGFVGSGGGENIALGQSTPQEVMEAWMSSDGHCANIMRGAFDSIGIGYHPGAGQRGIGSNYWTQNFGAPRNSRR